MAGEFNYRGCGSGCNGWALGARMNLVVEQLEFTEGYDWPGSQQLAHRGRWRRAVGNKIRKLFVWGWSALTLRSGKLATPFRFARLMRLTYVIAPRLWSRLSW